MPYLILAFGAALLLYALSRLLVGASPRQVRGVLSGGFAALVVLGLAFLAVSGRLAAALIGVVILLMVALGHAAESYKRRRARKRLPAPNSEERQEP